VRIFEASRLEHWQAPGATTAGLADVCGILIFCNKTAIQIL
jgi:hypothetical protein